MFTIDNNITDLKIKEKNMVKVFFSMNNHQVATPEMMLEEARSYIMFSGRPMGQLSSYIGLYLLLTGGSCSTPIRPIPFLRARWPPWKMRRSVSWKGSARSLTDGLRENVLGGKEPLDRQAGYFFPSGPAREVSRSTVRATGGSGG